MNTILITGANRGIGLEYCRQYKDKGDSVIAVCRTLSPELEKLGVEIIADIDVSNEMSVYDLGEQLEGKRIDIAINNAGIMQNETIDKLDINSIRKQFEVNTLGPLMVTRAILPHMANPSKLILMTSRMGSIADNTSGGKYGYRMSKAALNSAGVSLSHDLKDKGIAVAILHPGYVKTDMTNDSGNITAEESVNDLIARIDELTLENSGTFWHSDGQVLPW
ncbi:MAG: SDR family oxidoreductase [Gammaproteobacteria bacterium]|eukprot:Plantae.Rhodophyta-Purpureofilum_apyrenoidigerum.ctg14274.p2 GENE.Plantae.Rhodophyta-Purpureofilum_apyrenoidigerum.ctg14274~~Plantae.Rhodophyta-Purpureofilum_apyrenoidigerum.ctg14274.p2  ORF type:complete len:221 (+),score=27.01 Plantae.Rhodophyta-Purpureofilum_apyrenoidigerum.ctg14274:81-743(+)